MIGDEGATGPDSEAARSVRKRANDPDARHFAMRARGARNHAVSAQQASGVTAWASWQRRRIGKSGTLGEATT